MDHPYRPWRGAADGSTFSASCDRSAQGVAFRHSALGEEPVFLEQWRQNELDVDPTGNYVWPATLLFAAYLCEHPELVRGKRVVELGAGTGVAELGRAAEPGRFVPADIGRPSRSTSSGGTLVEGFDRRGTEPFELLRPEFGQISGASAKKSKTSGIMFNIFENTGEIPTKFHLNLSKNQWKEFKNNEFF